MIKKSKFLIFVAIFSLLFFAFNFSHAEEKISNFDVNIKVNADSSLLITENIKYNLGEIPKHGMFRDIPVKYNSEIGNKKIRLRVLDLTRDGVKENYSLSHKGDYEEIKIGDPSKTISGEHLYTITYEVKEVITYGKDFDEIYWNATGNNWEIPIENVIVNVSLPASLNIQASCYEGNLGSNEKCESAINSNNVFFNSNRLLNSHEGLTIAIGFPKGFIYQPTKLEKIISYIKDNYILILPIMVFFVMLYVWRKKGKDPKGYSTIIAQYEPPKNMKPTLVGSLVDERPDFRDITAGLIYLAEQGYLKITRLEKESFLGSVDYEIELLINDISSLEKTEQSILKLFFENVSVGEKIKISEFKKDLHFSTRSRKIISDLYQEMTDRGYYEKNPAKVKISYIIFGILFAVGFISLFAKMFYLSGLVAGLLSGLIIIIFGFLMGKKTKIGAETKDYILGFKDFLSVTEKDRLNFHNAPERKPEQFMEYLPYAIALGVENKWAKQFDNIYLSQPTWYQSNLTGVFIATNFISHMSDFSKSVSMGMSVGSNGAARGGFGSTGSGFSGGGFGGGGGGSW